MKIKKKYIVAAVSLILILGLLALFQDNDPIGKNIEAKNIEELAEQIEDIAHKDSYYFHLIEIGIRFDEKSQRAVRYIFRFGLGGDRDPGKSREYVCDYTGKHWKLSGMRDMEIENAEVKHMLTISELNYIEHKIWKHIQDKAYYTEGSATVTLYGTILPWLVFDRDNIDPENKREDMICFKYDEGGNHEAILTDKYDIVDAADIASLDAK